MGYDTRIVAFIDILGFSASVKKSNTDDSEFERIKATLKELNDFFRKPIQNEELRVDTKIIQASDSLIISRRIDELGGVNAMINDCSFAIHLLIQKGYLCRGAIKIGNLYHDEEIMFGSAYIDAYLTESKEKYPIIKFSHDLFETAKKFHSQESGYEDWEVSFIQKQTLEYVTGFYYINYFSTDSFQGANSMVDLINHYNALKTIIETGLKISDQSILEKYIWAADRFNKEGYVETIGRIEL